LRIAECVRCWARAFGPGNDDIEIMPAGGDSEAVT
jgi:hypothetical protein